jgi:hypothetical protein
VFEKGWSILKVKLGTEGMLRPEKLSVQEVRLVLEQLPVGPKLVGREALLNRDVEPTVRAWKWRTKTHKDTDNFLSRYP